MKLDRLTTGGRKEGRRLRRGIIEVRSIYLYRRLTEINRAVGEDKESEANDKYDD